MENFRHLPQKLLAFIIPALLVPWSYAKAQVQLSWESGSNSTNASAVYGTKGVPDAANVPSARFQGVSWADRSGNVWTFGGSVLTAVLNDMWRYNPSTKEWTWFNGSQTFNALGAYATAKGTPSADNSPGARQYIANWTDKDGNFWLFGGNGYAASGTQAIYLNDLWKYDPVAHTWTWVKGDSINAGQQPRYGTKGIADANNNPGGRRGSITWTDTSGNLWLFGGYGYTIKWPAPIVQFLNDLWKYDISTNNWTWMGGTQDGSSHGVYGTKGTAAANNVPGGRQVAASWVGNDGSLWLFGGQGSAKAGPGNLFLNDLWKYDLSTGQWTWINGSDTLNRSGTYSAKGVASATNIPGARMTDSYWKDLNGDFWLCGQGWTILKTSTGSSDSSQGYMSDLWKYSVASNEWTWYAGDSLFSHFLSSSGHYGFSNAEYGTKGTPSANNSPGGRAGGPGCADADGNFWLFSGYGYSGQSVGLLNDLWKIEVCTQLEHLGEITGRDSICAGDNHTYSIVPLKGAKSYVWNLPDGWSGSSTSDSITVVAGDVGGLITVTAVNECDTATAELLHVYVYPMDVIIQVNGFSLNTVEHYSSYQWLLNGSVIPQATDSIYHVTQNGKYQVVVTNAAGCMDTSEIYEVTNANSVNNMDILAGQIKAYPNPATDVIHIITPIPVNVRITSIEGKTVKAVNQETDIYIHDLAPGMYLMHILNGRGELLKVEKLVRH